ncbi:MAG: lytic polysaccharide monooxygenase [bacterium]
MANRVLPTVETGATRLNRNHHRMRRSSRAHGMRRVPALFLRLMFVIYAFVPGVVSHGLIMRPPGRQLLAGNNNCPQCSAAGGAGALQRHGGLHGLAGDPWDQAVPRDHEAGGKFYRAGVYSTVVQGSVLDIEILTTTNHYGRFEFRICKVSGGYDTAPEREAEELTEACLDENILVQANTPSAQEVGARYFYATPGDPEVYRYTIPYQLPEGLVCDGVDSHCVLQFQWQTLHGCRPEGWPDAYALDKETGMCGDPKQPSIYSEWFYNVADLVIVPPESAADLEPDVLSSGERVTRWFYHPSLVQYYDLE